MNSPINRNQTILKPVFSEKSSLLNAIGKYTFRVDPDSTKHQIKAALKDLYNVDAVSVTTTRRKSLKKRSMRTGKYSLVSGYKKAIIELKKGQKIDLFTALEK